MSSIPYKPRKSQNGDIGPTYYNPSLPATKDISLSQKGSSCMNSAIERFPLQHSHWGYPEPGTYEPVQAKENINKSGQIMGESAAFKTTTRDNYFYQQPYTITPEAVYDVDRSAAHKLAALRIQKRAYEKAKEKSMTRRLLQEAACAGKSLSRYLIESDPNYQPPPPPLETEALPQRPIKQEFEYDTQKDNESPNKLDITKINRLQNKYNLQITEKNQLLAKEIQEEIDQTKQFYDQMQVKRPTFKPITNQKLVLKTQKEFDKPIADGGIGFNTRVTEKAKEALEILEEQKEIEAHVGPQRYNTVLKEKKGVLKMGRQTGRVDTVKNNNIPGPGAYDVKMQPAKISFLVNEDEKFVL
ncbi:Conserved_hypothetical protein [Hexamita inflata]|uniref:Uncharacterized protein n=1 Tax=Hexamita inflata TaxID=28002 RepID=A0AA86P8R4_9EUKA|nr:Conserved hypothetical protein [Hexamita inflata]